MNDERKEIALRRAKTYEGYRRSAVPIFETATAATFRCGDLHYLVYHIGNLHTFLKCGSDRRDLAEHTGCKRTGDRIFRHLGRRRKERLFPFCSVLVYMVVLLFTVFFDGQRGR